MKEFRILTDNPAAGVRGPRKGDKKQLSYLYPSELLQLCTGELVPLNWRRILAITAIACCATAS